MREDKFEDLDENDEIPFWRKFMFYGGKIVYILGIVLFFSTFFAMYSGKFTPLRPVIAMCLIFSGNVAANVGKKGLAGSGVTLNPKKAREDLKPFSKAGGGMFKDAMDEYKKESGKEKNSDNFVVKVRCKNCGTLNDEESKFCKNCGERL